MKYVVIAGAVLAAVIVIVVAVGYALPSQHRAAREREYAAPPDAVFAAIATPNEYPSWRSDVKRVEMLPAENGRRRFREMGSNGTITYEIEESVAGRRLVTRIADTTLAFGGRWTFELSPASNGTLLRITEDGEVYNPVFRFMSRFVFGHHATIDAYLASLDRKLHG